MFVAHKFIALFRYWVKEQMERFVCEHSLMLFSVFQLPCNDVDF